MDETTVPARLENRTDSDGDGVLEAAGQPRQHAAGGREQQRGTTSGGNKSGKMWREEVQDLSRQAVHSLYGMKVTGGAEAACGGSGQNVGVTLGGGGWMEGPRGEDTGCSRAEQGGGGLPLPSVS